VPPLFDEVTLLLSLCFLSFLGCRGTNINNHVEREILNHRELQHPNVIQFREAFLTRQHLCIVMEYAEGDELFKRVQARRRMSEDEARYFFQQIVSGVHYCHKKGVWHRDLKLENCLLDSATEEYPVVKLADFGYSKHATLQSNPNSTVGTPAYIAPEVLLSNEYDGGPADVWSLGVTLYVMIAGRYPFEDKQDPRNFQKSIQRIIDVDYTWPSAVTPSDTLVDLLSHVLVADPSNRFTIKDIWMHPWFKVNLSPELAEEIQIEIKGQRYNWFKKLAERVRKSRGMSALGQTDEELLARQSAEEIQAIVEEARREPRLDAIEDDDFAYY